MATAAQKRRKSSKGRRRAPAKSPRYSKRAGHTTVGRERFRFIASGEARRLGKVGIDELVEHANWERAGAMRTGELNFRRPLRAHEAELLLEGDEIVCYVDPEGDGHRWRFVWRMVVTTPSESIREGSVSVALRARLTAAGEQRTGWKVRKGRRAHQVAKMACDRFRVPVGRLAAGKKKLGKLVKKKASVLDVVNWAYKKERDKTGRRFNVDMSSGRLEVLELRYPKFMHLLGPAILDATVLRSTSNLATVLTVTSTTKKKGSRKKKKVKVTVVDRKRMRRYGYIKKTINENGLETKAEARRWAKRWLSHLNGPRKDVTFTHPGIPWLDRGDAVRLYLRNVGLHQTVFVKSVRHTLSAGSYEMEVTVGFDDPYIDAAEARAKKKRELAAKRRKRKRERGDTHAPKSKKHARRSAA